MIRLAGTFTLLCVALMAGACGSTSARAVDGVLDLRDWDPKTGNEHIDGEWRVQRDALVPADENVRPGSLLSMPYARFSEHSGCATMQVRILLPETAATSGIAANGQFSAHTLYVDETPASGSGRPSCKQDQLSSALPSTSFHVVGT